MLGVQNVAQISAWGGSSVALNYIWSTGLFSKISLVVYFLSVFLYIGHSYRIDTETTWLRQRDNGRYRDHRDGQLAISEPTSRSVFGSRREKNYVEGGDGKAGKFYEENFALPDSPRLEMMVEMMVVMMVEMMVVMMVVLMMVMMEVWEMLAMIINCE